MFYRAIILISLVIAVSGCSYLQSQKTNETPQTKKEDFIDQIKTVVCEDADRFRSVKTLLKNMGVKDSDISVEEFEFATNIALTVKGKTDETVIVGGHYDKTTRGCGAIDNWTGIVIVANLYKTFKDRDNQKTYKFVAFGKEEKGLHGSEAMVLAIPQSQRQNYCAMVNFDSFGFTDLWALKSISDQSLMNLAYEVADNYGYTFEIIDYERASSDSKSFKDRNIPAITLSGLGDDWRKFLHKDTDQLENIDFDKVFDNFKFSYQYLNELDARPCSSFR